MPRAASPPKSPAADPTASEFLPEGRSFQPLARLVLLPGNPRVITTEQFTSLCASIQRDPRFLFARSLLVADGPQGNAGRIVYAGNMRARALMHLFQQGWQPSPDHVAYAKKKGFAGDWQPGYAPVEVDDIEEQQARERAIQDNNSWGQWNDEELSQMVAQMPDDFLSVSGFDQKVLEDLLASAGSGTEDEHQEDIGPNTEARMNIYQNAAVRQIVLYYPKDQYEKMLVLLDWLREHVGAETNTEAVTQALVAYQATEQGIEAEEIGSGAEPAPDASGDGIT